nr:MAG TPA: hypothetical protein [Caudoviricetes sp.]
MQLYALRVAIIVYILRIPYFTILILVNSA